MDAKILPNKTSPPGGGPPTVLVVDDDDENLLGFRIWLEKEGFVTLTAHDSKEALGAVNSQRVDVALLDYRLDHETGLDVAAKLSLVDEHLKMIMITGYPSFDLAVKSIKVGLFDYLPRGTSKAAIMETIDRALKIREQEIEEKKKAATATKINFAVMCRHLLIKERMLDFSAKSGHFRMSHAYNSLTHLDQSEGAADIQIVLICAACCIPSFDGALAFFNHLYRLLPNAKPAVFNETFSDEGKVELIRCGIKGFFPIDMGSGKLEKAMSLIMKGEVWAPRKLIYSAIPPASEYVENNVYPIGGLNISAREKDILGAMARGLRNKEIAEHLHISEMTVKSHIARIFRKFNVHNRAKAIRIAMENNLLHTG
jgi:DNA-binding NarL/FixJ family response regulator